MVFRAILIAMALGLSVQLAAAGDPAVSPSGGVDVVVVTRQGSRVAGMLKVDRLALVTSYGAFDLAADRIRKIDFGKGDQAAQVTMNNGDRMTGMFSLSLWPIDCELGPISLDIGKIRDIGFRRRASVADEGLLFWNRMGSPEEVERSEKGPGGKVTAGRFLPEGDGGCVEVSPGESECLVFPAAPVNGRKGCITIWARIRAVDGPAGTVPPFERGGGSNPGLFRLVANGGQFLLMFSGNNGQSLGGLCGAVDWIESAGSGSYGEPWTFDKAVRGKNVSEWHHYALVWDVDGFLDAGGVRHKTAVYVDGQMVATKWTPPEHPLEANPGLTGVLTIHGNSKLVNARVAFDEIRIWDYPKTVFTDELDANGFTAAK